MNQKTRKIRRQKDIDIFGAQEGFQDLHTSSDYLGELVSLIKEDISKYCLPKDSPPDLFQIAKNHFSLDFSDTGSAKGYLFKNNSSYKISLTSNIEDRGINKGLVFPFTEEDQGNPIKTYLFGKYLDQRFTIAHEIGHIFLLENKEKIRLLLGETNYGQKEDIVDFYAKIMLLPDNLLELKSKDVKSQPPLEAIINLCHLTQCGLKTLLPRLVLEDTFSNKPWIVGLGYATFGLGYGTEPIFFKKNVIYSKNIMSNPSINKIHLPINPDLTRDLDILRDPKFPIKKTFRGHNEFELDLTKSFWNLKYNSGKGVVVYDPDLLLIRNYNIKDAKSERICYPEEGDYNHWDFYSVLFAGNTKESEKFLN